MADVSTFNGKTLMITGGTGSFGSTVLKHFLDSDLKEIRIFSRDEKKQDDMRHELQAKHPEQAGKVKFYIGDVRNPQSIRDAMPGVDYIFHAAALKQVPSCEFFPMQAVQTNIICPAQTQMPPLRARPPRTVNFIRPRFPIRASARTPPFAAAPAPSRWGWLSFWWAAAFWATALFPALICSPRPSFPRCCWFLWDWRS